MADTLERALREIEKLRVEQKQLRSRANTTVGLVEKLMRERKAPVVVGCYSYRNIRVKNPGYTVRAYAYTRISRRLVQEA